MNYIEVLNTALGYLEVTRRVHGDILLLCDRAIAQQYICDVRSLIRESL